jgi:hypothetical protein
LNNNKANTETPALGSPVCFFPGEINIIRTDENKIVKVKIEPKVVTLMIIVEAPTTTKVLQGVLR